MNFCFQNTTIDADCIIQNSQKCQTGNNIVQYIDEFQQNCNILKIPSYIVRSSSLSRISDSCKKITLAPQNQTNFKANSKPDSSLIKKINQKSGQKANEVSKIKSELNAKSAIVNKLFQKSQFQNRPIETIRNKQNHNQKQKQNVCVPKDIFYHKHQNVQKMIKLYKEKQEKQLKECTFNPKFNSQLSARNQVDTKEFYNGQIEHCKRTEDKVEQLRLMIQAEKEKENTFRPKLSDETQQLTQRRTNNVYNRLYNEKKDDAYEQTRNQTYEKDQNIKRKNSKISISIVSNSQKKRENYQSHEKDQNTNFNYKNFFNQGQMKSSELRRQNSVKTFAEMLHKNQSKPLRSLQKARSNNPLATKRRAIDSKKQSAQNSQKKTLQGFGHQPLDCRELIKQKQQQSSNVLSREQSCKLMPSLSKEMFQKDHNQKECHSKDNSHSFRAKTSEKNQKIALQKFTKEFFTVVQRLGLTRQINFNQMLTLMKNMYFLFQDRNLIQNLQDFFQAKVETELKLKVFEIWSILQGDETDDILLINLFKIICAIQGYSSSHMVDQAVKNIISSFNLNEMTKINNDKLLILSQKDSKAIKKDFMNFYLTRFRLGESKMYARQTNGHIYSFRPSISEESKDFAQKYRERIIIESEKLISEGAIEFNVPQNGVIDHSMLLILDQKIKAYKLEQMRENTERQRRRKQDESMARHSSSYRSIHETSLTDRNKNGTRDDDLNSNVFSRISHNESYSRSKDQIFAELYENGRKSRSNRRDKSAEQIEYEESRQELTFTPKINQVRSVKEFNRQMNLHDNIPNFTKQVMRMRKNKSLTREDMSVSPLLYLNVTMEGNSQTKIPIFQTDNIHTITQKVRVMMKIENGEEEKQKLRAILKQQIIPVLDQLGIKESQQMFLSER